jgi:predicted Fe-Mo cluster-binding NifX family protein
MKIAVSTDSGQVSAHFGRCSEYTIFEVEDNKVINKEIIPNPGHEPGFLPRYLSERGVSCIIAGGMGPRAQQLFVQNNIKAVIGAYGDVDSVVEQYLQGTIELGEDACEHH